MADGQEEIKERVSYEIRRRKLRVKLKRPRWKLKRQILGLSERLDAMGTARPREHDLFATLNTKGL